MSHSSTTIDSLASAGSYSFGHRALTFLLRYGGYMALLAVIIYFSVKSPVFLTPANVIRILQQIAVLAVAAFGMTAVVMGGGTHVISGGIDLSIGANIGLAAGLITVLMRDGYPTPLALGAGLLAGLLVGLVNGSAVIYLKILPLLATLAMMQIISGVELLVTNNVIVTVDSDFVRYVADGAVLGMPASIIGLLAVFALFYLLLHKTPFGIHVQAIGGNKEAANRAGLSVNLFTILTYIMAGFAAWISAILVISRLSGSTRGIGPLMLLDILLATYVSAMFSKKWSVNIPGSFLGAVFVGILTNGFTMINVPTYWTFGIKGLLVLLVVSATSFQQKRSAR
ncbi:MAG: ABC transporter permease [Chloroflexota bacterium]